MTFRVQKSVRFHHCDPAGIVFYPQYFVMFHELLEDWFTDGLGIRYSELIGNQRRGIPTVKMDVDFIQASKLGDLLTFSLVVVKVGGSSIALRLSAEKDGAPCVRIEQVIVLCDLDSLKPVRVDNVLRKKMLGFSLPG
ncbi:thioesterase family protein [Caballeronia novacaledonica]|uniref:Acyl-CoA thioesterase n=1 Tax=Caballeronia novacaledonica TaxID=1544861 RepID=A0AA37IHF3_9BURK|nr:thioesterase family protein [Caballeronia novacaledonica]GJH29378.1 acyl-CoA thioesterase [Caballeronia novacaledonica]